MKRFLSYILVLAAFSAWPAFALAATDSGYTFHADIQLNRDASADVVETIHLNFSDQRHGIFRVIPYRYRDAKDRAISVPVTISNVQRNNSSEPFSQTKEGDNIRVKIGSSDETITGEQVYTIEYHVDAVVNFLDASDEFYWNVSGNEWDWTWDSVSATVLPPDGQTLAAQSAICYTGAAGSTASDCAIAANGSGVNVSSVEPLTVVATFPPTAFEKPANYDALRAGAVPFATRYKNVFLGANAAVTLLGFIGLFFWWLRHGRDPKMKAVTIAQYEPPDNASPGEVGVLIDERADMKDVSASIVNLAVSGYLIIHEKKEKKFLSTETAYTFERTAKPVPEKFPSHERALLDGLFASGTNVALKDLRTKFITTLKDVKKNLYAEVTDRGYFTGNPERVRTKYLGIGIALLIVFAIIPGMFLFFWGIAAIGAMLIAFAWFLPRRTPTGVEANWHARGFKLFLETAEKYRLKWQEKENIFEQYLPYAMVFGVADKWAKAFADLGIAQRQPSWYDGGSFNTFSTIALWSSLNSATNSIATSLATRPGGAAGGGSGFSGGFSGGGFGGGGGGSW
ncbi:MAG: DUF2207 domain-containing protein [Ilumatobacteraceae bacterium]